MRIKEITVSASRTINLGNYESLRVEGSCTMELQPHEAEAEFVDAARKQAIEEIKTQMNQAYNAVKPK